MDLIEDIRLLAEQDSQTAQDAWGKIEPRLKRFVAHQATRYVHTPADIEDVVATVCEKLWGHRKSAVFQTESAWWSYVATTAKHASLDLIGGAARHAGRPLSDEELDLIQAGCEATKDGLRPLLDAADRLWLQAESLSPVNRRRRLLAAQLFYLDQCPWQVVAKAAYPHTQVSRQQLDAWLEEDETRLILAYDRLYCSNDELCGHLLSADLAWTPQEQGVIRFWFRNGLGVDKIAQVCPGLTVKFIEEVIARCTPNLPFSAELQKLKDAYRPTDPQSTVLQKTGLWRRLVFQYYAWDDLPQKHTLQRVSSPADLAGVKLNAGVLNVWLSGGRILTQLLQFMQGQNP